MLTADIFKNTDVKCADNYIMLSTYVCDCEELVGLIHAHGVEQIIMSPARSIMRITTRRPIHTDTNVITTEQPSIGFLRLLWGLGVPHLNSAIKTYMMQGELKVSTDTIKIWRDGKWVATDIPAEEREWITSAVLGSGRAN